VLVNTGTAIDAFDASDGHLRWHQAATADGRPASTPTFALYDERTNDNQTSLVALRMDSGKLAWKHPIDPLSIPGDSGNQAIFASKDVVYLSDSDQTVMALKLADGQTIWRSEHQGMVVALNAQTVIAKHGFQPSSVAGLDVATGKSLWSLQIPTDLGDTVISESVVVTTASHVVTAVDARSGATLWDITYNTVFDMNVPLFWNGVLFLYSVNSQEHGSPGCSGWQNCPDYLRALKPDDGKAYWTDALSDANGFAVLEGND
jgi:outer membrane protein assembly factor BamB